MRRRHLIPLLVVLLLVVLIPVTVTVLGPSDPAAPEVSGARPAPDLPPGGAAACGTGGEEISLPETGSEAGKESPGGEEAGGREGAEPRAGPGASGEPQVPGSGDAPERAPDEKGPPGWFPMLEGTVVDVRTGEPIVGARLHYGPQSGSAWGADADRRGAFDFSVPGIGGDPELPFRLRVMATGYETIDVVPREGKLVVELIPRVGPAMPGRIRGRAEDKDGRPVRGVVTVALGDEAVMRHWLAVLTDEHGQFLLEPVEPGGHRIRLGSGDTVNVWVPEDGEAEVALRSRQSRETLEARTFTEEDAKKLEELSAEFVRAYIEAEHLEKKGAPPEELLRAEERRALLHGRMRKLDRERRNAVNRRPVRVTGVPGRDGSRLVAEWHGGATIERWWAVVRNGQAEFPVLFAGKWHLKLKSEDGEKSGVVEVGAERDVSFPTEAEPK